MRVLLTSGVYPPRIGGPSAQTYSIAQFLTARGIDVHVVTYGERSETVRVDGVRITYISTHGDFGGKVKRYVRIFRELSHLFAEYRPTVVHAQTTGGPLPLMVTLASRLYKVPTLVKYTSDLSVGVTAFRDRGSATLKSRQLGKNWRLKVFIGLLNLFQRVIFTLCDYIWATTPLFGTRLTKLYGVPASKILVFPNFVDLEPYKRVASARKSTTSGRERNGVTPRELVLLTVARLIPIKGIEACIEAVAKLTDLPVRYRIVGSGADKYENELRVLVERHNLQERVTFVGAVPPAQVPAEYAKADIFLLGSHYEAFGIVLVEAMAAGLPVVATRIGGIPTVVEDRVSGLLVSPDSSAQMVSAILRLASETQLYETISLNAQKRAELFDSQRGLDQLIEVYERIQRQY